MKKLISLLTMLTLLVTLAPGTAAQDNKNQVIQVLSMTEGATETHVMPMYHLTEKQLMEYWEAAEDTLTQDVKLKHLTMIRQRDIENRGESVAFSFRAWGAGEKYLVAFFRPAEQTEWSVVAVEQGEFLDVEFPGDGEYALAWSW